MGGRVWSRFGWVIAGGVGAGIGRVLYDVVDHSVGFETVIGMAIIAAVAAAVAVAVQFTASRRGKS